MDDSKIAMNRRTMFAVGGLGAALTVLATKAGAAPAAAGEKANIKLVEDFIKTWGEKDFDADKETAKYLTTDCSIRMVEDQPAAVGPAAVAAAFKGFMTHGERVTVKILETFAKGPVVVNHRIDTMTTPGKPDQAFKVVGVWLVKNGKIKEWTDYSEA